MDSYPRTQKILRGLCANVCVKSLYQKPFDGFMDREPLAMAGEGLELWHFSSGHSFVNLSVSSPIFPQNSSRSVGSGLSRDKIRKRDIRHLMTTEKH